MSPLPRALAAILMAGPLAGTLAGCTGDGGTPAPSPSASPTPTTATPVPAPAARGCHRLTWEEAIAPAAPVEDRSVPCGRPHTAQTYAVGRLDTVVDGHLLAVDSARVSRQAARECPRRLADLLGGTAEQRRLSMVRAVWFTPSLEESDAGADWYRCDAIAVAAEGRLAELTGRLDGVLEDDGSQLGVCGTAEPGTPGFARVICREPHTWRAISTVDLPPGDYPGAEAARAAGEGPCQEAARAVAADALDYQWGYEWPTAEQWADGQTWGICWAPEDGA